MVRRGDDKGASKMTNEDLLARLERRGSLIPEPRPSLPDLQHPSTPYLAIHLALGHRMVVAPMTVLHHLEELHLLSALMPQGETGIAWIAYGRLKRTGVLKDAFAWARDVLAGMAGYDGER
jgi:hypothetical protein